MPMFNESVYMFNKHDINSESYHDNLLLDVSFKNQAPVINIQFLHSKTQSDEFECVESHQTVKDTKMQLHRLIASLYTVTF